MNAYWNICYICKQLLTYSYKLNLKGRVGGVINSSELKVIDVWVEQLRKGSFIKLQASGTSSDNEWQRMTTSDNERQRMTTNGRTNDNDWQLVTTSGTANDNEWQWMTTSGTTGENERQRVTISANFYFFQIREESTTKHPKENSLNLDEDLWRRPIELRAETSS